MSADAPARRRLAQWLTWLFAAIGVLGVVAIIALAVAIFSLDRPYQPARVADGKHDMTLTVGEPHRLGGTNLLAMDISSSEGGIGSGPVSGGRSDVRNILIVDSATGASRRLLPDNVHHIVRSRFYPAKAQPDDGSDDVDRTIEDTQLQRDGSAAYYVIQLRRDGDPDREDLLVGTLATGRQSVVTAGLDGVDGAWMLGPTRIGLLVRERLGLFYRIVDIPSLHVVQSRPVPID